MFFLDKKKKTLVVNNYLPWENQGMVDISNVTCPRAQNIADGA